MRRAGQQNGTKSSPAATAKQVSPAVAPPVRVGCISYLNSVLFYYGLAEYGYELVYGTPAELTELMGRGEIAAGLLPIVGIDRLGDKVEPLGEYGIACDERALSVVVFSRVPLDAGERVRIGVTEQTVTSAQLLRVVNRELWRNEANTEYVAMDAAERDAVLIIGDDALRELEASEYAYRYDLGAEWRRLTGRSFVFARWAVSSRLLPSVARQLADDIGSNLARNLGRKAEVLGQNGDLRIEMGAKVRYVDNFRFIMSSEDIASAEDFIRRVKG